MEKQKMIECIDVSKSYYLFNKDYKIIPWLFTKKGHDEEKQALKNINLTINKGDVIGFIGKNGAGKSTLMKMIAGITSNTTGSIEVNGKVNSLINLGAGFNALYTGRQNIYYKGTLMGLSTEEIDSIIDEIENFCELGSYFDLPTKMYSSGMTARLGFALAIFTKHDILMVDEVFAVGDKVFKQKSEMKMKELFDSGECIIFASHSDAQLRRFCNRAIFIDEGEIVVDGSVEEALEAYNKKYEPRKIEDEEKKYNTMFANFVNSVKTSKNPVQYAGLCLFLSNFYTGIGMHKLAYAYIKTGISVQPDAKALIDSEKRLSDELPNVDKIVVDENWVVKYLERFENLVRNREIDYPCEIYREIAILHELNGEYTRALDFMKKAYKMAINDEVDDDIISEKIEYYESKKNQSKDMY